MRKVKKILATALSAVMMLTLSLPAFATHEEESDVLTVRDVGHGEFKIDSAEGSRSGERSGGAIRLTAISNRNGFYEDDGGAIYLKCTESSLLQVDEVPIDVSSMDEINQVIKGYGLSDVMAEDLRKIHQKADELRQSNPNSSYPQVVLYTARDPVNNEYGTYSITPKEPRYYTYNGHNLKDDVLYSVYVTPFRDYVFQGRTTSDKLKNIADVSLYVIGAVSKKLATFSLVGSGASLAYGILQGWIDGKPWYSKPRCR